MKIHVFSGGQGRYEPSVHQRSSGMLRTSLVSTAVLCIVGCATEPAVQMVQPGPDVEKTFDGLVAVERSGFGAAWVRPEVDFSRYRRINVADPVFEFRTVGQGDAGPVRTREFPLTHEDKTSLIDTVHETFLEELAQGRHYTLSSESGPDIMSIEVRLLDVVALVPEEDPDFPALPYLSSVGEATLVIEIHDSESGEILYRAVQRRAARETVGGVQSSRINGWAEIEPAARRWASLIRTQLDRVHDMA